MGKRKSKARVIKKTVVGVPTQFDCLFCNHSKTVECKLNQSTGLGTIKCRVCNTSFQTEINHLTDPIDIYSEWIDETEKANRVLDDDDRADGTGSSRSGQARQQDRDTERDRDRDRDPDAVEEEEHDDEDAAERRRRDHAAEDDEEDGEDLVDEDVDVY